MDSVAILEKLDSVYDPQVRGGHFQIELLKTVRGKARASEAVVRERRHPGPVIGLGF